jgi:primosomal protein N' (replication factor Y)
MGIESVHEKLSIMFPNARIITLSSDSAQPSLAIESIYKGEVDIIVSTQILSKGYTFPNLTLVAVIHSCQGLVRMDPRSYEKVYQLLTQVRGRCGRNGLQSTFLVQTNTKNYELIDTLVKEKYEVWADSELKKRELHYLPPFYSIIRFIISSKYPKRSLEDANKLYTELYKIKKITTFPPAVALLYRCRDQFRYNIIVRYPMQLYPQRAIRRIVDEISLPHQSRITVDVDPQVFI